MEIFGRVVVYIIMICAVAGAIASAIRPESELGQQFVAGIDSIGPIFLPVAGIMAAAPYLTAFVSSVFGPAYGALGADPAMAATTCKGSITAARACRRTRPAKPATRWWTCRP